MSFVESYLKRPYLVTSLILLAAVVGLVGYKKMPVNLFPDSERPQIAVVSVYPGASAADVESEVSRTIEKELNTIEQVRRVTSVSKDEVSAVTAEFQYPKGLEAAATDVANALQKIKAQLPAHLRPPMIFKVSSATPAVLTIALRPKQGSPLDLSMVRQLADNPIKERLLQLPHVREAILGFLLQCLEDSVLQDQRNLRVQLSGWPGGLGGVLGDEADGGARQERQLPGGAFVQDDPHGVYVGAAVHVVDAIRLFGCHVVRGAQDLSCLCESVLPVRV